MRMAGPLSIPANTHTHCPGGAFPGSAAMQMMVHISSCRSRGRRMLSFTFVHWLRPRLQETGRSAIIFRRITIRMNYLKRIAQSCMSPIFTDPWRTGAAVLDSFPTFDHSGRDRGITACLAKHPGPASQSHRIGPMSLPLKRTRSCTAGKPLPCPAVVINRSRADLFALGLPWPACILLHR